MWHQGILFVTTSVGVVSNVEATYLCDIHQVNELYPEEKKDAGNRDNYQSSVVYIAEMISDIYFLYRHLSAIPFIFDSFVFYSSGVITETPHCSLFFPFLSVFSDLT